MDTSAVPGPLAAPAAHPAAPPSSLPPAPHPVPPFPPVPPGGRRRALGRLRRTARRARLPAVAALTAAATALAVQQPRDPAAGGAVPGPESAPGASPAAGERPAASVPREPRLLAAPVRIADPEAARLLSPGDHVDVLAGPAGERDAARVIATRVPVAEVPAPEQDSPAGCAGEGALVVLSVPRSTAAALAGAAAAGPLSVARW
ncbi:RcpC/CpaB family pilus assembly protein [Streptomyces sodiiphilus]